MRKLAQSCLVLLFGSIAIGPSQLLALPLLPACEDCRCYSNCNQLCIVDHFPEPGSHEEICDLWLCNQFPECSDLAASTSIGNSDLSTIDGIVGSCPIAPSSSNLLSTDARGEAHIALVP